MRSALRRPLECKTPSEDASASPWRGADVTRDATATPLFTHSPKTFTLRSATSSTTPARRCTIPGPTRSIQQREWRRHVRRRTAVRYACSRVLPWRTRGAGVNEAKPNPAPPDGGR